MKQSDKSFLYVILISVIVCGLIGFAIIKSGESYDKELYAEVYEELENFDQNNTALDNNGTENYENRKIIAIITIDKIGLKSPILREETEENLKIAPVKFSGVNPNEVGNFCIAGHNYGNDRHFGKLSALTNGDIVKIKDAKGNNLEYKVYSTKIVNENDLSCISQATDGKKEITLITCTKRSNERLAVKCVEV